MKFDKIKDEKHFIELATWFSTADYHDPDLEHNFMRNREWIATKKTKREKELH